MSWSKCPRKDEVTKRQKYIVPSFVNKYGTVEYYLTPEQKEAFKRLYPVTMNRDMMGLFGLSFSTLQRFKRELGLKKDTKTIKRKHTAMMKRICEQNGYYDSLRGKKPSEQCIEASRRWWAEGNNPKRILKENNPRKYRSMLRRQSEQRKALFADERRRVRIGLSQSSSLHIPQFPFSKQQIGVRYRAVNFGYILGDRRDNMGERYTIFYDKDTDRKPLFERNFGKYGFSLKQLPEPKKTHYSNQL